MTHEQHQSINFLPHELEEKRRLVKEEIRQAVSYTEPEPALDFIQRKKLPPLSSAPATLEQGIGDGGIRLNEKATSAAGRPGLFSRLFGRKPKLAVSASPAASVSSPAAAAPPASLAQASEPLPVAKVLSNQADSESKAAGPMPAATPAWSAPSSPAGNLPPAAPTAEKKQEEKEKNDPSLPPEDTLNVNLLSQEYAQAFVLKNQLVVYGWALAVAVLAVAVGFAGAKLYETREQSRLAQERGRNQALSEIIVSYRDLAVSDGLLKRKVQALRALLKKHISFKTFLEQLEAVTIPEVTYQNIAVTGKGGVNLAARAADYTAAARQLSVFQTQAPWIKTVVMTGARAVPGAEAKAGGVMFDLALTVDEGVFILKE